MELFRHQAQKQQRGQPLAARMRPLAIEGFFGQRHLLGEGKLLARILSSGRVPSIVFWGPPGTGKTTLARMIAKQSGADFVPLSAVGAGVKELREAVAKAKDARDVYGRRTILFVDEIHRFNKAQQDALLPHVEDGTVVLIGATTENPSFEVNAALLSRVRVLRLEALDVASLVRLMRRALADDRILKEAAVAVSTEHLEAIANAAGGDARRALTTLEVAISLAGAEALDDEVIAQALQGKTLLYDRCGDEHFNVISAFIKSMRASDPDGAVYWLARMLEAGEDPRFILRRLVIFASEDIGNADPGALQLATSALTAFELVGLPEGVLPLTQAVSYLASAPKSNSVLTTYARAKRDVHEHGPLPVPLHLRNAPTALMRASGHGEGYRYPHDFAGHFVAESCLPEKLEQLEQRRRSSPEAPAGRFYRPSDQGHEREIGARLARWQGLRAARAAGAPAPVPVRSSHPPLDD